MDGIISIPQPANTRITSEAFWDRFTNAELVAFEVACQDIPTDTAANRNRQAKLRIFRREVDKDGFFDFTNAKRTNKVSGLLVTEGILTADRATAILTDPIQPGEVA